MTPVLFECAVAGNLQRLVALLQDGDNVNPVVSDRPFIYTRAGGGALPGAGGHPPPTFGGRLK